jgi:hypothetical protein
MQFHTLLSIFLFFFLNLLGGISAHPLTTRFPAHHIRANVTDLSLGKPATGYRSSVYFVNWVRAVPVRFLASKLLANASGRDYSRGSIREISTCKICQQAGSRMRIMLSRM